MSASQPVFSRWVSCQFEQPSAPAKGQVLIASTEKKTNRREHPGSGFLSNAFLADRGRHRRSRQHPRKSGAGALARVLSLATTAWVYPKAEAVGSSVHYRRSQQTVPRRDQSRRRNYFSAFSIAASASGAMILKPAAFGCNPSSARSFFISPLSSTIALK